MTKIIRLILCFLLLKTNIWSQVYSNKLEFKTVIQQRSIYLNGGARASVGGKSRTIIPINLPEGTKSWYYSFSTSPGESGTENLNLLIQLSSMLTSSGFSKALLSNVNIPSGSSGIDVYILDQKNADAFIQKVDNNGGTFYHYREGLVTNTRQAVVGLTEIGDFNIGLKNPSTLDGVYITIEVIALVETQVYKDTWSAENKHILYDGCLKSFALRNSELDKVCDCYTNNVITEHKPSTYLDLSTVLKLEIQSNGIKKCSNNHSIIETDKKIKELLEISRGQSITKDYAAQEKTLLELLQLEYTDYYIYSNLGFCQLCLGKNEEAKNSLQIGLGKKPTDLFLLGNLANYFLLTGSYNEALKIFKEYKKERLADNRKFKVAIAEDLQEFERLGLKNQDFNRIKKELRIR